MAFFDHNHTPNGTVDLFVEKAPRNPKLFAEVEHRLVPCPALMP
jgi:hypothetical protein